VSAETLSVAAERNKAPILEVLLHLIPPHAEVLEIASGTGQHVQHMAKALPSVHWQPSEYDASGVAHLALALDNGALPNIRTPVCIDVHAAHWSLVRPVDVVVCINMIHIAPASATHALFAGARRVLRAAGGSVVLYGPFREGGRHTAPSNETFDQSLRLRNAAWGVRDLEWVDECAGSCGFKRNALHRLPANNCLIVWGL
jgi:hypothetical protein